MSGTNTTIKSKRPYREFLTLRILIVSISKHVQTRTQLLVTHIFDNRSSTSTFNNITRAVFLVFGEMTFCFIQFRLNDVRANAVSGKRRSAERRDVKMTLGWTTIPEKDVRLNNDSEKCRSALWSFPNSTNRSTDFQQFFFGKTTILTKCISAKRRFDEMTFRENDVALTGSFRYLLGYFSSCLPYSPEVAKVKILRPCWIKINAV